MRCRIVKWPMTLRDFERKVFRLDELESCSKASTRDNLCKGILCALETRHVFSWNAIQIWASIIESGRDKSSGNNAESCVIKWATNLFKARISSVWITRKPCRTPSFVMTASQAHTVRKIQGTEGGDSAPSLRAEIHCENVQTMLLPAAVTGCLCIWSCSIEAVLWPGRSQRYACRRFGAAAQLYHNVTKGTGAKW